MEVRKAEKRDVLDFKQKSQLAIDAKVDKSEVQMQIVEFTKD